MGEQKKWQTCQHVQVEQNTTAVWHRYLLSYIGHFMCTENETYNVALCTVYVVPRHGATINPELQSLATGTNHSQLHDHKQYQARVPKFQFKYCTHSPCC